VPEEGTRTQTQGGVREGLYVGDILVLFDHLNLSPINTILLVVLGLFIRSSVASIFCRVERAERKNRKQDWAIRRIEQHLKLQPIAYDDDED
jgi:hypothetical protein